MFKVLRTGESDTCNMQMSDPLKNTIVLGMMKIKKLGRNGQFSEYLLQIAPLN